MPWQAIRSRQRAAVRWSMLVGLHSVEEGIVRGDARDALCAAVSHSAGAIRGTLTRCVITDRALLDSFTYRDVPGRNLRILNPAMYAVREVCAHQLQKLRTAMTAC